MAVLNPNGSATSGSRVDSAILAMLRGQDLAGFEIWRRLGSELHTAGLLAEPDLYPTLYRLEASGQLRSDWQEGERTRLKYRLTAVGTEIAEKGGGPPVATETVPGRSTMVDSTRSNASDPEADLERPAASPDDDPNDHEPNSLAITRYSDELGAALDLPLQHANRVGGEIADHLADSVRALQATGLDASVATTQAIGNLGSVAGLADRIERAQQTRARLRRGIRAAIHSLVDEVILAFVLSVLVIMVLAPTAADFVVGLAKVLGGHVTVLRPGPWAINQLALVLCVGAFSAGRISMGHLARISRHRDATLRARWAVSGAAALLLLALLFPGFEDALTVATMLAIPVCFVAGTFRPSQKGRRSYSIRGVVAATLVVLVVMLLPGVRTFAYDPTSIPGTTVAPSEASVQLIWAQVQDGTIGYQVPPYSGSGVVTVELWPATTGGPFILIDKSATAPAISVAPGIAGADASSSPTDTASGSTTAAPGVGQTVDFTKLPAHDQWWTVLVVTSPDGTRTARDVEIQTGLDSFPTSALNWILSKI